MDDLGLLVPLLRQLRWKPPEVTLIHSQVEHTNRTVTLRGPDEREVVVRVGAFNPKQHPNLEVLERLSVQVEPGLVPFLWAQLSRREIGFLTESRPVTHPAAPDRALGYGLLQLLGILQTLRDCGAEVTQLSPMWLHWERDTLPRLVDYRWLTQSHLAPAGYWTHPRLLRGSQVHQPPDPFALPDDAPDTAVWSAIQLVLARFSTQRASGSRGIAVDQVLRDNLTALLATQCAPLAVLSTVFRGLGLPEIADGESAVADSPSSVELPRWDYSPRSASKSPLSRRRFTSAR